MKDEFVDDDDVASVVNYVVYDKSGKIVFHRRVSTYPGASSKSDSEEISEALELVSKLRERPQSELSVLNLGKEELEEGFSYSVDFDKKRLIKGERVDSGKGQKVKV